MPEDKHLGIRPEQLLNEIGELEFIRQHQCLMTSLKAFDQSTFAGDWQDLMQLYMVRRTRRFIKDNYARQDETGRKYLEFANGKRSPFPDRQPKTIKFPIGSPATDPYAWLYSEDVVQIITDLNLPRYGLGNYIDSFQRQQAKPAEEQQMKRLSHSGKQLRGFCRANLFKRLESSGTAFIQSIERHILRNYVYLHAIGNGKDIPIGSQDAELLDTRNDDEDSDSIASMVFDVETEDDNDLEPNIEELLLPAENGYPRRIVVGSDSSVQIQTSTNNYHRQAASVYNKYATQYQRRFKWIRPTLFNERLKQELLADAEALTKVLKKCGTWDVKKDQKLAALVKLLQQDHPQEKVLIFSQFADTVRYVTVELNNRGIASVEGVTGNSKDPTGITWRFSPESNEKRSSIPPAQELRVLIATDVLSEGQNLQDCAIIVNYDLPWAIVRLIQRAGRVDRIGQKESVISCYSFLPADGVERIINLRSRLRQRLQENAEVVGTDEIFFEDEQNQVILDTLYNEQSGILDSDEDTEVDLISEAYQIWKNATDTDPSLKKTIENMPNLVYSTRAATPRCSEGVILLMKTVEDTHSLIWIDRNGNSVTQSQTTILRAAACKPDTPASARDKQHHELVIRGVQMIFEESKNAGGQLGGVKGARFRTYERLKQYAQQFKGTPFDSPELHKAIEEIYRYPLRQPVKNSLNRQLNIGISDQQLAELVITLCVDDRLCLIHEEVEKQDPQIICSLRLFEPKGG